MAPWPAPCLLPLILYSSAVCDSVVSAKETMSSPKERSPDLYEDLYPPVDGKRWYEKGHPCYVSSEEEVMPDAFFYNAIADTTLSHTAEEYRINGSRQGAGQGAI
jgi:hypothetical protein